MLRYPFGRGAAVAVSAAIALALPVWTAGVAAAEPAAAGTHAAAHIAQVKHDDDDDDDDAQTSTAHGSKAGSPCAPTAKACVDLSSHRAWLTDGAGKVIYGPVAARGGSEDSATPTGSFNVLSKDANYFSREFKAPMPYSVFFYPGDAFHASNPASNSNGCIHLAAGSAQRFYSTLRPGDSVEIKN